MRALEAAGSRKKKRKREKEEERAVRLSHGGRLYASINHSTIFLRSCSCSDTLFDFFLPFLPFFLSLSSRCSPPRRFMSLIARSSRLHHWEYQSTKLQLVCIVSLYLPFPSTFITRSGYKKCSYIIIFITAFCIPIAQFLRCWHSS